MGFLVRFVPHAVMTGFLNGVGLLIVLGQLANFTGYRSSYSNPIARALDTALNLNKVVPPIVVVGVVFVVLVLLLGKTRASASGRCSWPSAARPRSRRSPASTSCRSSET